MSEIKCNCYAIRAKNYNKRTTLAATKEQMRNREGKTSEDDVCKHCTTFYISQTYIFEVNRINNI